MTSKVEKSIEVEAPLQRAYNQWTQFEQFPQFMAGVEQVKQLSDTTLHWIAKIAGVKCKSLLANGFMPLVDLSEPAACCVRRPSAAGAAPHCAGGPTAGS